MGSYQFISVSEYEAMLDEFANSPAIDLNSHDLLLYGGGGQDRSFYPELAKDPRVDLLWTGWPGPKWTRFLSFIPGEGGLLRLKDLNWFKELYYELAANSVSEFMYVPKAISSEIVHIAHRKASHSTFEPLIRTTAGALHVNSEADEAIPQNGEAMYFYNYCFGPEADAALMKIITRK